MKVVESGRDDESIFMFDAYVDECKALGYTVDASSSEGFYSADNAEGYNVYLYYESDDGMMSGTIEAPEN